MLKKYRNASEKIESIIADMPEMKWKVKSLAK